MDGRDGSRRRLAVLLSVAAATVAAFAGTAVAVGAGSSSDRPDAKTRAGEVQKGGDRVKAGRTHTSGEHCHGREGRMGPGGAL